MGKSITRNATFNMMYKALSVIFPLVIVSYASRKLGATGIGLVSSAQNLVTYFTMFAALGIPSYGVRIIAQTKKNKLECNKTFTELFLINLVSTIISIIAYFILIMNFDHTFIKLNYIFSSLIFINIFNVEWVYEAFEEYKYIAIRSFLVKGISLIALFVFVKNENDLFYYSIIVCLGIGGNYLLNLFKLREYVKFNFKALSFSRHFHVIMTFFGAVIAIELYSLLDITMLTYMTNSTNVGYYSNATKIIKMLANTMTAIGAVLLPRLSLYFVEKKYDEVQKITQKFLDVIMILAIPACIGMILISDQIVYVLFGVDFKEAISTVRILSPLIILMPLSGGIFGQILLTSGKEKVYFRCVCSGAFINIILNIIFIGLWKQNGAAFASICTEIIVSFLMILYSNKVININFNKGNMIKVCSSVITFAIVVLIIKILTPNISYVISMTIEILTAIAIYIILLSLLRHELIVDMLNKIKKRCSLINKMKFRDC
ncbi:TPA: flippase [Clostridium perfringens]|nr:flippase [Clostridium perfringens]HAT4091527.1 flippase [Clostridium perfringens]